jgi:redox-sensitive bicupin YhaK (pirin superfamily)
MKTTTVYKAETRGHADHGWLNAHHSFSFANYYDPNRMHFGVLRVLNDDIVAPGMGFGTHPHDNMEIITIPLDGDLAHKDSMGNSSVIKHGDIQVMSAGTGIQHSEFNPNKDKATNLLQIWLFPNKKNVTPRYDQITLNMADRINKFQQVLSPNADDEGVWIHQDAWFHLGKFDKDKKTEYTLKNKENGVYAFIISGKANIEGNALDKRDAIGITGTEKINISIDEANTEILLMEVPMSFND